MKKKITLTPATFVVLGLLVVLVVYFFAFFSPAQAELATLRADISLANAQSATYQQYLTDSSSLEADIAAIQAEIDELNDNIIAANSIYAMNEQDLASRKAYAQKAIANGYQLQRKLSRLIRCVPSATAASLEEITSLLSQEIDDLKGWRKNDKIRAR